MPSLDELVAQLRLWVDVQGTVTNPPRGPFNCFWSFDFAIEHSDGSRDGLSSYCAPESQVVPEGPRLIEFSFAHAVDVAILPGDRFTLTVMTYGAYGPGSTVEILSGTADADSSLTVQGLQLPLDTRTLL